MLFSISTSTAFTVGLAGLVVDVPVEPLPVGVATIAGPLPKREQPASHNVQATVSKTKLYRNRE